MIQTLQRRLLQQRADGLYRQRRMVDSAQGPQLQLDGREVLAFCANDYLGLAADPRLAEALCQATQHYGVGSGAAHLISGHSSAHHALEEELADFLGTERALLFSTGYMANLGVLSALLGRGDTVFQDKLNHASLLDGAVLSQAKLRRYIHNDMASLQRLLEGAQGHCLLASDGVFSMDGDIAPLGKLAATANAHKATLMIDDAHGFGVLGKQGRGSVQAAGLAQTQVPIYMATLGKALGVAGAFVAGPQEVIETLIQAARSYVYTTAMPAALAAASRRSLQIMAEEQWRRDQVQKLVALFRHEAANIGLSLLPSVTPIQPIVLNSTEKALQWSEALLAQGIWVSAIRPPTVPKGSARLRVTLSAAHTQAQLERLLEALQQLQQQDV